MADSSSNSVLQRWLITPDESEAGPMLDELLEHQAGPLLRKILHRKLRTHNRPNQADDVEELTAKCLAGLFKVLQQRKDQPDLPPIKNFDGYVSVTAFNAYNQYCREHAPNRNSLKDKIRYLIKKPGSGLALWQDTDGDVWAGPTASRDKATSLPCEKLVDILKSHYPGCAQETLGVLAPALFEQAGGALPLDDVVTVIAALWGVTDAPQRDLPTHAATPANQQQDLENRATLALLWQEIKQLPYRQRAVLLYNLRDGTGQEMLSAIFNAGLASLPQLAQALETPEPVADLLPRLPLKDDEIGALLHLTRQEVSNLRRVARDSLRRRLEGKPKRNKR